MQRVRILRTTAADGRLVRAGDVVELSDTDARILLASRKAEVVTTTEAAPEEPRRRGRARKGA